MGWSFKWISSFKTDFNFDFNVSFSPDQLADGTGYWNYKKQKPFDTEMVGISVFYKDASEHIFRVGLPISLIVCRYSGE
jgi:predicted dithiol-disulfide oxidoreductase (DUF899 family)